MKKHRIEYSYISLIGGLIGISTGPLIIKYLDLGGITIAIYRFLYASFFFTIIRLIRERTLKVKVPKALIKWVLVASIAFALNIYLWSWALTLAPISVVTILDNTAPVWVGLGSIMLFAEKKTVRYWVGLFLTIIGAALLIQIESFWFESSATLGILLSIASGFVYAVFFLASQHVRKSVDTITYLWMLVTIGAVFLVLTNSIFDIGIDQIGQQEALLIGLMTLSSQIIGWFLINYSLGYISAAKVSTVLLGQPIIASILAGFFFKEIPSLIQIIGALVCLVGIYLVQVSIE